MGILEKLFGKKKQAEFDVIEIGDDGIKEVSAESFLEREKLRQEHERAVEIMDSGDYRSALKIFSKVLKATQDDPEPMTYLNIAVCHAHLGEFKQSLSVLEEAIRRWPDMDRLRQNYEAIKRDLR